MIRSQRYLLLVWAALAVGCDPSAKANSNERALNLSNEHESCASSMDCAAGLRCFEQVCRSADTSLIGAYYAALGARALAAGESDQAIEAYNAAINRFESDKKPVPVGVRCARGRALLAAGRDSDQAEAAARSLHRCLREAPAGSGLRAQALAHLAQLHDNGLDPELLARENDMSAYLTKKPAGPNIERVKVSATGDARGAKDSYGKYLERIQSPGAHGSLVACWQAHWQSTQEPALSVTLPFRYRFEQGEFEEDDRDRLRIEGAEAAPGTPERCVADVLSALAEEHTKGKRTGHRWTANITVRVGE